VACGQARPGTDHTGIALSNSDVHAGHSLIYDPPPHQRSDRVQLSLCNHCSSSGERCHVRVLLVRINPQLIALL